MLNTLSSVKFEHLASTKFLTCGIVETMPAIATSLRFTMPVRSKYLTWSNILLDSGVVFNFDNVGSESDEKFPCASRILLGKFASL